MSVSDTFRHQTLKDIKKFFINGQLHRPWLLNGGLYDNAQDVWNKGIISDRIYYVVITRQTIQEKDLERLHSRPSLVYLFCPISVPENIFLLLSPFYDWLTSKRHDSTCISYTHYHLVQEWWLHLFFLLV